MRHIYILFIFISGLSYSQIPSNYYDSANGLSGYFLKTELKNIITNGHLYNSNSYDNLFTVYGSTDRDYYYENDATLLDIYSENPFGSEMSYDIPNDECGGNIPNEGLCYNREHLFPQGFFNNSDALPMVSDIHTVVPTDGFVNNGRSNYPFGIVSNSNTIYANGSKWGTGNNYGYTNRVFEPIDEFKGDIARAMLYFAVRYEDNWNDSGWDAPDESPYNPLNGTSDQFYETWFISTMLDWHTADPVSQRELDRNDEAYNFQGNANPFVNHPEYAALIWNPMPDTQEPTVPTDLTTSNPSTSTIDLSWTASTDNTAVTAYDTYVDGSFYVTTNSASTTFTVTGLTPDTTYTFTILAKDGSGNSSAQSAPANGTTQAGSSTTNELFFSEYIEGSSLNKALEIANFTGNDITSLSAYELKISTNGSASWNSTYNFPNNASISNGDVYVIANGSLSVCTGVVDNQNNTITGFNGNDTIGLFKNGALIDILGILGNSDIYASNTTLVRKPEIAGGSSIFDISQWNIFASNTCDNLGTHNQALGINNNNLTDLKIFPNPATSNKIEILYNDKIQLEIFDILGKKIKSFRLTSNRKIIDISSLKKGIYLLKLNSESVTVTKKFIRQ